MPYSKGYIIIVNKCETQKHMLYTRMIQTL